MGYRAKTKIETAQPLRSSGSPIFLIALSPTCEPVHRLMILNARNGKKREDMTGELPRGFSGLLSPVSPRLLLAPLPTGTSYVIVVTGLCNYSFYPTGRLQKIDTFLVAESHTNLQRNVDQVKEALTEGGMHVDRWMIVAIFD